MKKSNYILGYCPRCSKSKSGKDAHGRYLFKCKMFGSIPAYKCSKCGFVFREKES